MIESKIYWAYFILFQTLTIVCSSFTIVTLFLALRAGGGK